MHLVYVWFNVNSTHNQRLLRLLLERIGRTFSQCIFGKSGMTVDHLTVDYYYKKGYHESDRFYRRLSDNSSGVSSGYDESASSDTSEGPDITVSRPTTPSLSPVIVAFLLTSFLLIIWIRKCRGVHIYEQEQGLKGIKLVLWTETCSCLSYFLMNQIIRSMPVLCSRMASIKNHREHNNDVPGNVVITSSLENYRTATSCITTKSAHCNLDLNLIKNASTKANFICKINGMAIVIHELCINLHWIRNWACLQLNRSAIDSL